MWIIEEITNIFTYCSLSLPSNVWQLWSRTWQTFLIRSLFLFLFQLLFMVFGLCTGRSELFLCCRYTGVARHMTGEGFVNPLPAEKGERQAESWALLCLYGLVGLLLHQIILPEGIQMDVFGNTAISLETDWSVTTSTNSNFNSSWNVWTLSVWSFLMVYLSHWVKGMLFFNRAWATDASDCCWR